jgi:histidinol phosphatase-like enzyme (inositol monophosphatase family)
MDLQQRLNMAQSIASGASQVAMSHFRKPLEISSKSDASPVTIADQQTERAIRSALEKHFPDEAIFGEEYGQSGTAPDMWIIDPIDGTRSFITGFPLFGLLLGYVSNGLPQLGVINMPALGENYSGAISLGAHMNGAPITTSACETLEDARIFVNEGEKLAIQEPFVFERIIRQGAVRRMSADCYPHALVASGSVDCVIDFDLQPYDYLPVSAVVEAAGGIMTDWQGQPLTMASDGRTLTAATQALHSALLDLVNP